MKAIVRRLCACGVLLSTSMTACGSGGGTGPIPAPSQKPTSPSGPVLTAFSIPRAQSGPLAVVTGPDGNLWFTESVGEAIARVSLDGEVREFPVPGASQHADLLYGISRGPASTLWVTDANQGALLESTTAGAMRRIVLGAPGSSGPSDLALDAHGALWVADGIANAIEQVTPDERVATFPLPTRNSLPYWIVCAAGDVWFTEEPGKIGRAASDGRLVAEYPTAHYPNARLLGLANARGSIWYADAANGAIGELDPSGIVREFALPAPSGERVEPFFLTGDDAGNVWFTAISASGDADAVGRIDADNRITMLPLPDAATPSGIVFGPDRNIWFLEAGSNQIVRLSNLEAFGTASARRSGRWGPANRTFARSWLAKIR